MPWADRVPGADTGDEDRHPAGLGQGPGPGAGSGQRPGRAGAVARSSRRQEPFCVRGLPAPPLPRSPLLGHSASERGPGTCAPLWAQRPGQALRVGTERPPPDPGPSTRSPPGPRSRRDVPAPARRSAGFAAGQGVEGARPRAPISREGGWSLGSVRDAAEPPLLPGHSPRCPAWPPARGCPRPPSASGS